MNASPARSTYATILAQLRNRPLDVEHSIDGVVLVLRKPSGVMGCVGALVASTRKLISQLRGKRNSRQSWLLGLPVAVLAIGGWSRRWVTEDAFINFRVVDVTLRARQPFAFNAGERVEAATSPLWVAALAVLEATLGRLVDLEWLSVLTGLGLSLLGLAAAVDASSLLARRISITGRLMPAGALVLAVLPPAWDFATSGLETGLTFGWLGVCYWLLTRRYVGSFDAPPAERPTPSSPHWLPVVLGLGPLLRPDLGLFSAAFLVAHLGLSRPGFDGYARGLALALTSPGAFQAFRMAYFGALAPNPALVKEAGAANWAKGVAYLENYASTNSLVVPTAVVGVWAVRWLNDAAHVGGGRLVTLVGAPVVAALLHGAYITRVGGDFMHGRLLLPGTFGLCMAAAALPLDPIRGAEGQERRARRSTITTLAASALTAWAVRCVTGLRETDAPPARWSDIVDERTWWQRESGRRNPVTLNDYFQVDAARSGRRARQLAAHGADALVCIDGSEQPLAPGAGVILEAITVGLGSMSAGPNVHVVDVLGLGDAFGSRITVDPAGRIGHQKRLPRAFMFARIPMTGEDNLPPDVDGATLEAARRILRLPAVARLSEATRQPLTLARAIHNILRSATLTRLRIPIDPIQPGSSS